MRQPYSTPSVDYWPILSEQASKKAVLLAQSIRSGTSFGTDTVASGRHSYNNIMALPGSQKPVYHGKVGNNRGKVGNRGAKP